MPRVTLNLSIFLIVIGSMLPLAAAADARPVSKAGGGPEISELWTRYGTGLVIDLAVADTGGGALLVGGRGAGAVGRRSLEDGRFVWANKWEGAETPGGDGETVQELRIAEVNGDGVPDALVGSADGLFAMDGRTGHTLWVAYGAGSESDFTKGAWDLDTADFDNDGVLDAAFGDLIDDRITGVDGQTGSVLWSYARDGAILDIAAGDLDMDGREDVVVVGSVDFSDQFEVHAIDGATMQTGEATALWTKQFPIAQDPPRFGDPRVVVIGQVTAATPQPEVVVAGGGGYLTVYDGPSGKPVGSGQLEGSISDLVLVNVDGDQDLEIVASNDFPTTGPGGTIEAFEPTGKHLWTRPTSGAANDLAAVDLNADGAIDVVATGGWQGTPPEGDAPGFALALDPRAPSSAIWTKTLAEYGSRVVVGRIFGTPTIAVGQGQEGGVWGLDRRGRTLWYFRTGGRVEHVETADLDGDGNPEVLEGADDSTVAVSDANGDLRWAARVPGLEGPDVLRVGAGDLTASPGLEVVAGTWEFDFTGPRGRVHAYSASGRRLWSVDMVGAVNELLVGDLEADGANDVLVATSGDGSAARYSADGTVVWSKPLDTGTEATMVVVDANGDGVRDVIVGRKSIVSGTVYALDGRDGTELWQRSMPAGINWLATTGRPRDGILAGDLGGGIFRLRAGDGDLVWSAGLGWSSWDGGWSIDANRDGTPDVASVFEDAHARMLDGRTGDVLWEAATGGQRGLTVTTVRRDRRAWIAAGTYGAAPITPNAIFVFDAATGTHLDDFTTQSMVLDLTPADLDGEAGEELLAGAGWQVHALDLP